AGQRARQYVPFGADDDGVAAGQPVAAVAVQAVAAGQVRGQVGGADAGGDADDVGAALPGDVPQGRHPDLGVVPGGRHVDVDALGVQGGPGQGHVVLAADQPAEPAESGVDDLQGRSVARPPHQAFATGGHELAVPGRQRPVRGEVQQGVVDRGIPVVALVHAYGQPDPEPGRRLGEQLGGRGADDDRLVE